LLIALPAIFIVNAKPLACFFSAVGVIPSRDAADTSFGFALMAETREADEM
jgi:hypothetical protein